MAKKGGRKPKARKGVKLRDVLPKKSLNKRLNWIAKVVEDRGGEVAIIKEATE